MIIKLWYYLVYGFRLIFLNDPIRTHLLLVFEEIEKNNKERILQYETTILSLRSDLTIRDGMINELQERLIKILSPKEEPTITIAESNYTPVVRASWNSEKERLEQLNSRRHREEVLKNIAAREAEVEEELAKTVD